jgi:SAM-dependent methyltransferase
LSASNSDAHAKIPHVGAGYRTAAFIAEERPSVSELDKIRERYARRTAVYEPWDASVYMSRQELERRLMSMLKCQGMLPPDSRRLLDMGCGTGSHLLFFVRLGFLPERLVGVDLLEERTTRAKRNLPGAITLLTADAASVDLPEQSFDIVFQSMMFSSVLDADLQRALAERMWSLVCPGGGVLWYDFIWNNPRNNDVRGVSLRRVRELFPDAQLSVDRVTLAPPMARVVARIHPMLYSGFNLIPCLRTHILCWLGKPAGRDAKISKGSIDVR